MLKLCQDQRQEYRARQQKSREHNVPTPLNDEHDSNEKGDEISDVREDVKDDKIKNDDPSQLAQRSSSSQYGAKADSKASNDSPETEEKQATADQKSDHQERTDQEITEKKPGLPEKDTAHALVVDDNKINLRLLVTLMKKWKYPYEQAENGLEALNAYKACSKTRGGKQSFDFVLMDIGTSISRSCLSLSTPARSHIHAAEPYQEHYPFTSTGD